MSRLGRLVSAQLRSIAISVLSNLHEERSVPALIQMLADGPEWGDRSLAGQALVSRWHTKDAVAAVRTHVAKGGNGKEIYVLRGVLKDFDDGKY